MFSSLGKYLSPFQSSRVPSETPNSGLLVSEQLPKAPEDYALPAPDLLAALSPDCRNMLLDYYSHLAVLRKAKPMLLQDVPQTVVAALAYCCENIQAVSSWDGSLFEELHHVVWNLQVLRPVSCRALYTPKGSNVLKACDHKVGKSGDYCGQHVKRHGITSCFIQCRPADSLVKSPLPLDRPPHSQCTHCKTKRVALTDLATCLSCNNKICQKCLGDPEIMSGPVDRFFMVCQNCNETENPLILAKKFLLETRCELLPAEGTEPFCVFPVHQGYQLELTPYAPESEDSIQEPGTSPYTSGGRHVNPSVGQVLPTRTPPTPGRATFINLPLEEPLLPVTATPAYVPPLIPTASPGRRVDFSTPAQQGAAAVASLQTSPGLMDQAPRNAAEFFAGGGNLGHPPNLVPGAVPLHQAPTPAEILPDNNCLDCDESLEEDNSGAQAFAQTFQERVMPRNPPPQPLYQPQSAPPKARTGAAHRQAAQAAYAAAGLGREEEDGLPLEPHTSSESDDLRSSSHAELVKMMKALQLQFESSSEQAAHELKELRQQVASVNEGNDTVQAPEVFYKPKLVLTGKKPTEDAFTFPLTHSGHYGHADWPGAINYLGTYGKKEHEGYAQFWSTLMGSRTIYKTPAIMSLGPVAPLSTPVMIADLRLTSDYWRQLKNFIITLLDEETPPYQRDPSTLEGETFFRQNARFILGRLHNLEITAETLFKKADPPMSDSAIWLYLFRIVMNKYERKPFDGDNPEHKRVLKLVSKTSPYILPITNSQIDIYTDALSHTWLEVCRKEGGPPPARGGGGGGGLGGGGLGGGGLGGGGLGGGGGAGAGVPNPNPRVPARTLTDAEWGALTSRPPNSCILCWRQLGAGNGRCKGHAAPDWLCQNQIHPRNVHRQCQECHVWSEGSPRYTPCGQGPEPWPRASTGAPGNRQSAAARRAAAAATAAAAPAAAPATAGVTTTGAAAQAEGTRG